MSAIAGCIDCADRPTPSRRLLPPVIVAGASESGPRHAVTRPLTLDVELDLVEDSAPRLVRRPGRR